jgi:hypothetical protein
MKEQKAKIPEPIKQVNVRCPLCFAVMARNWITSRKAEALMCHFCKITIMANDPFINCWEETYSKGAKVECPACAQEMRFFCTSTGYTQLKCPMKKCQTKWETAMPDRKEGDVLLFDRAGEPISLPGVDRAVATPEQPSAAQVAGGERDLNLPAETEIKLLPGAEKVLKQIGGA